jgi:hypothetical protein
MNYRRVTLAVAGAASILLLSTIGAWAQFTSGIEGTVTDPSGAVVPNVDVVLKNVQTGALRTLVTSAGGYYRFVSLPAAGFTITVSATGFKTTVREGIQLEVDKMTTVNVSLELGTTATQVTVNAVAPPVELSQGRVTGLIGRKELDDIPLVARNLMTLVVMTPGVSGLPSGGGQAYAQATGDIFAAEYGVNLNANGQRAESNLFLLDSASITSSTRGGVTNVSPNEDSIQEIRISVNDYSAEFGRNSSALVSMVSKSGTNKFHGSAAWYHTDNELQSRNIYQVPSGPVFRRNEGAWSFGGPIWKDHTFAFGSMDILRSGVGQGFASTVETPQLVNYMSENFPNNISTYLFKTFPSVVTPVRDFTTAGQIAGIDCSTLGSPSAAITTSIGSLPCDFAVQGVGNLAYSSPRNGIQWNARIDHIFNNYKDRIFGAAYRTTLQTASVNTRPQWNTIGPQYVLEGNLNWTHTFSPNVVNEVAIRGMRSSGVSLVPTAVNNIPGIGINSGPAGMGAWGPAIFTSNNFEEHDMLAINRGRHNFKTGFVKLHANTPTNFVNALTRPSYSFLNVFDFVNDMPYQESGLGFNPASYVPGKPGAHYSDNLTGSESAFFQDDWKVKPNLTLNLGIRMERFDNPSQGARIIKMANLVFQGGDDFFSRIANAKIEGMNHLWAGRPIDWAPRFAFAWDPTKNGKMSIRGGIGIFYDAPSLQIHEEDSNLPYWAATTASIYTPSFVPLYALAPAGTAAFTYPTINPVLDAKNGLIGAKARIATSPPDFGSQYSENWFLGIQRSFGQNWVIEADYLGSAAHHTYECYDVNRRNGDLIINNNVLTRLNTSFGEIQWCEPSGNSFYSGGALSVKKAISHGLMFQSGWTYGKAIDYSSTFGQGLPFVDVTNKRLQRGRADFDVRHKLALLLVYDFPKPHAGSAALNGLLGGWEVSANTILQTGSPFTVYCSTPFSPIRDESGAIVGNSGCDFNADGFNYDTLNQPAFGNSKNGLSRSDYLKGIFKASDFPTPGLGQDGSLGRNTFQGPGYANTNFALLKNTKIPWFVGKEGANLQLRGEFFNAFNRVNLTGLDSNTADATFGQTTSTYGARNIQVGLKLTF